MLAMLLNIIRNTTPWFFNHGIKIVAIVLVAYLIRKLVIYPVRLRRGTY